MKKLILLLIVPLTVFFSFTVIAQEMGAIRKSIDYSFPVKIQSPLGDPLPAGTYTIGSGGYFPTIQSAFDKLSTDGVAGAVTLELIDNLYTAPADSFGFFLNGPILGARPNSGVTIKPAPNKNVLIEGSGQNVISFINTDYLKLDGIDLTGQTTLTIRAYYNALFDWNRCVDFFYDSDNNVIQNITFISDDYTRYGCGPGFWTPTESTATPDSNLIQNNFIKKAGQAIYVSAWYYGTVKAKGNVIRYNTIGSESDSLINCGIQVQFAINTIIENNVVQNIRPYNNDYDITFGINSYFTTSSQIRNNIVHNIKSNRLNGSTGILLSGTWDEVGNINQVYNNMVYDISTTTFQASSRVAGIQMYFQHTPIIFYNTVYLSGNGNGTNPAGSAAIFIAQYDNLNVDIRNNILVNTRDESPYCASVIRVFSGSPISSSNFNDLYYEPNQYNCLVSIISTDYHTLAEWQATGKDLNSISELPHFTTSTDLHIDKTYPTNLERGATPIASMTTDFDGDLRNAATPDIGADEFDGFTFEDPLPAGTYTIGNGGNFETIQHAFDILSQYGVAGNVTLELIDELYTAPTGQYGYILNGPIAGASPNSRVTIKPADNKNVTIEGNNKAVLWLLNTSYLTFDGVSLTGATTLTIHTLHNAAYNWNDGIDFVNNSDHNVMQNIIFIDEDYTRASGSGFGCLTGSTTEAPDSNLIQNNFVKQAGMAFFISSDLSSVRAVGNIIRGNKIGSETDSLIAWGIQVEKTQNTIIENNIVQNIRPTNISERVNPGINSYSGSGDIIRNNIVHNFKPSIGYSSVGILLSGGLGSNNSIYNNMVYDISSTSSQSDSRVAGIQIWNQTNPKIYYNTVYLSGTGNGANPAGSAAFYIYGGWGNSTNIDLKNNIFLNTRDESPYCASTINCYNYTIFTSDYNDLYYEQNPYNCLVKADYLEYLTLADWQATGKDLNSITEMPNFVGSDDLHIVDNILTLIDGGATPIVGIETDIDGEERNSTVPDIGADEFTIVGVEDEKSLPTEFTLEQNYPNPFNPSTKISWQSPIGSQQIIKVYDVLGNEIATLVDEYKPAGKYEVEFSAASLPSGVYFYQLKAGEYVQTLKMILIK